MLEGLDAAVSVLSVQQGELLLPTAATGCGLAWDARGHTQLANTSAALASC